MKPPISFNTQIAAKSSAFQTNHWKCMWHNGGRKLLIAAAVWGIITLSAFILGILYYVFPY
jgi:hypothetical protein